MNSLQDGSGPSVKDSTADSALVVNNRTAITPVDARASFLPTVRANQSFGMEKGEELVVANLLVHVIQ